MDTVCCPVELKLQAHTKFIPLIQGVVEQAALAFGLERDRALRLTMSAEEIMAHIAATAPGEMLRLAIRPGGWCVHADFSFAADPAELWAMNLDAMENIHGVEGMEHMGLLLAARMNDAFSVRLDGRVVHLELRQDRNYTTMPPLDGPRLSSKGQVHVAVEPEAALVVLACARAMGLYGPQETHSAFHTPDKIADMLAQGDIQAALAMDEDNSLCGMLLWSPAGERTVGFHGPYIFVQGQETARLLEDHMLHDLARGKAKGLFSRQATKDLDTQSFESLGQLSYALGETRASLDVWYRHLSEDPGGTVWSHPRLSPFLQERYESLVFMRRLRETDGAGTPPARCVFSCRLRPELTEAVLLPLVAGADADSAVARHVAVLRKDGYRNLFFHLDLAYGWQAALVPALLDNGFAPVLLLPDGGKGDVVVFQHE